MKQCPSCGNAVDENSKFCPVCGSRMQNDSGNSSFRMMLEDFISKFNNTANTTADYASDDISRNRHMAILDYLGLLFLVPLFAAKNSQFARYHVNQGIILFVVHAVGIAATQIPYAGWVAGALVNVFTTVLMIIGIINAFKGEAKELPIIGKFRILK